MNKKATSFLKNLKIVIKTGDFPQPSNATIAVQAVLWKTHSVSGVLHPHGITPVTASFTWKSLCNYDPVAAPPNT